MAGAVVAVSWVIAASVLAPPVRLWRMARFVFDAWLRIVMELVAAVNDEIEIRSWPSVSFPSPMLSNAKAGSVAMRSSVSQMRSVSVDGISKLGRPGLREEDPLRDELT